MKLTRLKSPNDTQIKIRLDAEALAFDGQPDALHTAGITSVTVVIDKAGIRPPGGRRYAISTSPDVTMEDETAGFVGAAPESDEALAEAIVTRWLKSPGT